MSGNNREMIHVSLGSSSNEVSAHLLNLQGLSVTKDGRNKDPFCEPYTTHSIDRQDRVWIPRTVMVDEPHRTRPTSSIVQDYHRHNEAHQQQQQETNILSQFQHNNNNNATAATIPSAAWDGRIETFSRTVLSSPSTEQQQQQQERDHYDPYQIEQNSNLTSFLQTASTLAHSPYSRYRVTDTDYNQHYGMSSQQRHVNWDELGDEEEEDNDEYNSNYYYGKPKNKSYNSDDHKASNWQQTKLPIIEQQLSSFWGTRREMTVPSSLNEPSDTIGAIDNVDSGQKEENLEESPSGTKQQLPLPSLPWMDYWMPPYSIEKSVVSLPMSSSSNDSMNSSSSINSMQSWENSYITGHAVTNNSLLSTWKEDELWEKVRHQLEDCDSCQGFTMITQGEGFYSGLTSWLCQELHEECKSSNRFVIQIDNQDTGVAIAASTGDTKGASAEAVKRSSQLQRIRKQIQSGLALHGLASNATAVLPVSLSPDDDVSSFISSGKLAMALETATLPYRLKQNPQVSKIGIYGSYYGYNDSIVDEYKTSFNEYMKCLQQPMTTKFSILELDSYISSTSSSLQQQNGNNGRVDSGSTDAFASTSWPTVLKQGTSVERDFRMKHGSNNNQSSRNNLPGLWMMDKDYDRNGILSSFSPHRRDTTKLWNKIKSEKLYDRSLHRHYSLSTTLRPPTDELNNEKNNKRDRNSMLSSPSQSSPLTDRLTCVMESMGVKYKPEISIGAVLNQSFDQLISGNSNNVGSYGAGSYWKQILRSQTNQQEEKQPLIAVLGNTTRIYPLIYDITSNMKQILSNKSRRGFCNVDVANGILPEFEDCDEAMELCYDIQDVYEPPSGSGLVVDEGEIDI